MVGVGARRDAWRGRWAVGATGVAGGSVVIAPGVGSVCERELGTAFTHAESRADGARPRQRCRGFAVARVLPERPG